MKRLCVLTVALLLSVTGAVARPAEAASSWRAWQTCSGALQVGGWVGSGGVSYTPYCHGNVGTHGCSGGPTMCYLFWQSDGAGHYRTAAIPQ